MRPSKAKSIDPRLHAMAVKIARGFRRRLPANVCLEDLEQAALIGLVDALQRHPTGEGPGYEHYLRVRIRGGILDELRAEDWNSRRNRSCAAPTRVVHLDDVSENWSDSFAGRSEDPELAAIARLDTARAWSAPMGARHLRMMRASYDRGRRQAEISEDEGVSEARVSQCITRGLQLMRRHLTRDPPLKASTP